MAGIQARHTRKRAADGDEKKAKKSMVLSGWMKGMQPVAI